MFTNFYECKIVVFFYYIWLGHNYISNMRKIESAVAAVVAAVLLTACNEGKTGQEFWLGADLGWITEYESLGYKFYNNDGQEMECTALMKELGLNAVRHRVWVDPSKYGNWCGKEDLLVKCKRAKALDMEILLSR